MTSRRTVLGRYEVVRTCGTKDKRLHIRGKLGLVQHTSSDGRTDGGEEFGNGGKDDYGLDVGSQGRLIQRSALSGIFGHDCLLPDCESMVEGYSRLTNWGFYGSRDIA